MLIAALVLSSGAATSQTIYRCGQTYPRVPCPNAKAIEVEGRRSTAQRAEARPIAQREKRMAQKMANDRRVAEAAQQPPPGDGRDDFVATVSRVTTTPG